MVIFGVFFIKIFAWVLVLCKNNILWHLVIFSSCGVFLVEMHFVPAIENRLFQIQQNIFILILRYLACFFMSKLAGVFSISVGWRYTLHVTIVILGFDDRHGFWKIMFFCGSIFWGLFFWYFCDKRAPFEAFRGRVFVLIKVEQAIRTWFLCHVGCLIF